MSTPAHPRRRPGEKTDTSSSLDAVKAQWNLNFLRGVYLRSQHSDTVAAGEAVEKLFHGHFLSWWRRWRSLRSAVARRIKSSPAHYVAPLFYEEWRRQQARGDYPLEDAKVLVVVVGDDASRTLASLLRQTLDAVVVTFTDLSAAIHEIDTAIGVEEPEWIGFVRAGDELIDDALNTLVAVGRATNADVVFADEDRVTPEGRFTSPQLRGDALGPHTLWSYNAVGFPHLIAVAAWRQLGGIDAVAKSAGLYDFFLRASLDNRSFVHHPRVLLTRPMACDVSGEASPDDLVSVLSAHWQKRGLHGEIIAGPRAGTLSWRLFAPSPSPRVEILIPTRDRLDLLTRCLASLEQTNYENFSITILDNDSVEPATRTFLSTTRHRVVVCPGVFNYAAIMNTGVRSSTADVVVTLNNDTEILSPDWLNQLVGVVGLPEVGIVGCRHVDRAGHVRHAGIIATPDFTHVAYGDAPTFDERYELSSRDVLAVTGACTALRRAVWNELSGMDETFAVEYNDADLCLRALEAGYYVVYLASVSIYHEERASRGPVRSLDDTIAFFSRWDLLGDFRDPYFSKHYEVAMNAVNCRVLVAPANERGFFQHAPE